MATPVKRQYSNLAGVDFKNEESLVDLNRSPDALNVWKNYADTQWSCIETRPGYVKIGDFGNNINGIYFYDNQNDHFLEKLIHLKRKEYHSLFLLYNQSNLLP